MEEALSLTRRVSERPPPAMAAAEEVIWMDRSGDEDLLARKVGRAIDLDFSATAIANDVWLVRDWRITDGVWRFLNFVRAGNGVLSGLGWQVHGIYGDGMGGGASHSI